MISVSGLSPFVYLVKKDDSISQSVLKYQMKFNYFLILSLHILIANVSHCMFNIIKTLILLKMTFWIYKVYEINYYLFITNKLLDYKTEF